MKVFHENSAICVYDGRHVICWAVSCWCSSVCEERKKSLGGQRDAPSVSNLTLLQVLHQLGQPVFGGGVILQDLGKGGVFKLVREALSQSFSGSAAEGTNTGWT